MQLEQLTQGKLPTGNIAVALSNIVPLIGVLMGYWSAFDIIFLYWFENIIIGIFTVCRMTIKPNNPGLLAFAGLFTAAFFCVHYGFFTYGHGIFVTSFFEEQLLTGNQAQGMDDNLFSVVTYMLQQTGVQLTLLAMFIGHFIEYIIAYRNKKIDALPVEMFKPYKRIIILHIAIILGGFIATLFDNTLGVALVMIGLKTFYDLRPPQFKKSSKAPFADKNLTDEQLKDKIRQQILKLDIKVNGTTHHFDSVQEMVNSDIYKKHWKCIRFLLPRKHRKLYNEMIQQQITLEQKAPLTSKKQTTVEPKAISKDKPL